MYHWIHKIMVSGEIGSRLNLNVFFRVLNFRLHPVVAILLLRAWAFLNAVQPFRNFLAFPLWKLFVSVLISSGCFWPGLPCVCPSVLLIVFFIFVIVCVDDDLPSCSSEFSVAAIHFVMFSCFCWNFYLKNAPSFHSYKMVSTHWPM